MSKKRHHAAVERWKKRTCMLRKEKELNKNMNRQLAQWLLGSCDDEYSEIQHITVKQDGTNFPGFTMTGEEIDIVTEELKNGNIMLFQKSDGKGGKRDMTVEEMRLRLFDILTQLHFHEWQGRLIGSKGKDDNGKDIDFSTVTLTFIHQLFTKEEAHNIVLDNTETNPDWRVGKTLTQKGQAANEPIHDINLRIHSQFVKKGRNGRKDRLENHYNCRYGTCGSMAVGGRCKGFCKRHAKIHGKDYSDAFPFHKLSD